MLQLTRLTNHIYELTDSVVVIKLAPGTWTVAQWDGRSWSAPHSRGGSWNHADLDVLVRDLLREHKNHRNVVTWRTKAEAKEEAETMVPPEEWD